MKAVAAYEYVRTTLEELAQLIDVDPDVNPLDDGPLRNYQIVNALRDWITSHSG